MPRHLPVLRDEGPEDAEAARRPRGQWVLIGAGLTTTLWAPLAVVVTPLGAAPLLLAFGVAAAGAGALVGRFGGRARPRDAAHGGLLAALLILAVAVAGGHGLSLPALGGALLLLSLAGGLAGWAGGAWGFRKRPC